MSRPRDIDVMRYADGELTAAEARSLAEQIEADPEATAKLGALEQVGETVRTYLELAGDRAEADGRFDAMWSTIEQRVADQARASASPASVAVPARAAKAAASRGAWAAITAWFDSYRGHVITGAISAGAVAALIMFLRPSHEVVRERTVMIPAPAPVLEIVPANLPSTPPEVVELEVVNGSGTVFTMADEDGDGSAAVIWVTSDDMEGPI